MILVLLNVLGAQFLSIDSSTIPMNKEDVPIQSDNISQLNTNPKVSNDTDDSEYDLMRIGKFVPQVWEYDDLKLDIWVFTVNNNASNNHLSRIINPRSHHTTFRLDLKMKSESLFFIRVIFIQTARSKVG